LGWNQWKLVGEVQKLVPKNRLMVSPCPSRSWRVSLRIVLDQYAFESFDFVFFNGSKGELKKNRIEINSPNLTHAGSL
jgi:hypothetical protein